MTPLVALQLPESAKGCKRLAGSRLPPAQARCCGILSLVKLLVAVLALTLAAPSLAEAQVFRGDSLTRRRPAVARPAKPARAARPKATPKKAPKAAVKAKPAPAPAPKGEGDVIVIIEDA